MSAKTTAVLGTYTNWEEAETAIQWIASVGFTRNDIEPVNGAEGILLSIHCATSDQMNRAKEMLEFTGAENVSVKEQNTGLTENIPILSSTERIDHDVRY